jgi:hypothetical protein
MTALAHSATNDTRLEDAMAIVRELARDQAAGDDAMPSLGIHFCRIVYDGVLDTSKDLNNDDGAARVFKAFVIAAGKKAIHDRTEKGLKSNISKLRQIGYFASNPKWDAVDIFNRAHVIMRKAKQDGIELKSPYPAYVDVAREQLKHDEAMTDEMILSTVIKSESTKEVTLEGELKKAQKIIDGIITGEKHPGIQLQSPELLACSENLDATIKGLAPTV